MDQQAERLVGVDLARPAGDELFSLGIDVALAEGRGIERIEDLLQVRDVDFNERAARRESFERTSSVPLGV